MSYTVRLSRRAEAYLDRLDSTTRGRILRRLDDIAADPFGPQSKRLKGAAGLRATRVGDYRIVFEVDDTDRIVLVGLISPRGQVYRDV